MNESSFAATRSVGVQEQIYQELKRQIILGSFAPGEHLTFQPLADSFGSSVQPVREAVHRLAAEQAIELTPNKGARIPRISREAFLEIAQIRKRLASLAAEMAAEQMAESDVANLREILTKAEGAVDVGNASLALQLHFDFYDAICTVAKSVYLNALIQGVWLKVGPIFSDSVRTVFSTENVAERGDLHRRIVDALEARDPIRAKAAVEEAVGASTALALKHVRFHRTSR